MTATKETFQEILKSDHPLLALEREILQSYTLAPNEKVVLIENFDSNSFKTYAVYVDGQYDRKIHIRK
jgi:aspartate 1-decarboxylase